MSSSLDSFNPNAAIMVASIDFGTTYSGYSYSFKDKPNDIIVNQNWGEELSTSSYKTPTSVLIDGSKQFVSFGYKAEHAYSQCCAAGKGGRLPFVSPLQNAALQEQGVNANSDVAFQQEDSKQTAVETLTSTHQTIKKLSRTTKIASTRGTEHMAADIFAMALQYFKYHLQEAVVKETGSLPAEGAIQWVLTIPAIWNDQAKQFMREAAWKTDPMEGLQQLQFALEPEAASVFCRSQFAARDKTEHTEFPTGTKYMIIDAGGGTVDITAHEIKTDGNMIELICASGGDWGGNQVDRHFEQYMAEILGQDFLDVFRRDCPSQWLSLMNEFERKKRMANMGEDASVSITLPWSMFGKYMQETGKDLEVVLNKASKGCVFNQGSFLISAEQVCGFFTPILDNIVDHIRGTLISGHLQDLDCMLFVGGFSQSRFLFQRMKDEFSSVCRVISPHCAILSVLQGAVLFGHKPQVITARRARKTYGDRVLRKFIKGQHHEKRMYVDDDGEEKCSYCFRVYVTKDELVEFNSSKKLSGFPNCLGGVSTCIFSTEKKVVTYVDEPGVKKIGELTLEFPVTPGKRKRDIDIETRLYFGQTEIKIEMQNMTIENGEVVSTSIDFLKD